MMLTYIPEKLVRSRIPNDDSDASDDVDDEHMGLLPFLADVLEPRKLPRGVNQCLLVKYDRTFY